MEAKENICGTWHSHRYLGARSDSDLYTFGYRFKPWVGPPIATAAEINKYLRDVVAENGLDKAMRFGTFITRCSWSGTEKRWTVETRRSDGSPGRICRANFLWMCQGYYDHQNPYLPNWPGIENYKGKLVHAQKWDDNTDYAGKEITGWMSLGFRSLRLSAPMRRRG